MVAWVACSTSLDSQSVFQSHVQALEYQCPVMNVRGELVRRSSRAWIKALDEVRLRGLRRSVQCRGREESM